MSLTLDVLSLKGRALTEPKTVTVRGHYCTIGRSVDSTLVLPDPNKFVSRHHASIKKHNGVYYLTDSSLCGVYIDKQEFPVHNQTVQIYDGSLLKIGEYEIAVAITEEQAFNFPFSNTEFPKHTHASINPPGNANLAKHTGLAQVASYEEHAGQEIPGDFSLKAKLSGHEMQEQHRGESVPIHDEGHVAHLEAARQFALADASRKKIHLHSKAAPGRAAPSLTGSTLFAFFLQGAKLEEGSVHPKDLAEAMRSVGEMFRQLVEGAVSVLRSRAEFKSLCRASMTVIKTSDNNPLKFAVSTDEVLRQLIENKKRGIEDSVEAIEEGFGDIMNHQLAMQAGIQAALADLLKTFDPKNIEQQIEQGLILHKKTKCWEKYEAVYKETADEALENFFGHAFIAAYEKQMKALQGLHHKKNR